LASARERAPGNKGGQAADAREAHSTGRQRRHKPQGARQRRAEGLCRGARGAEDPRHRARWNVPIPFSAAGRARNRGMRPMEAAEVNPVHSGKRHALVWNAADHNNAPGSAQ